MDQFEYEKQIKAARDRLAVADGATASAAAALRVIAQTLISEHAPREVEAAHTDIVEAGAHARSTLRTLADLSEQAKEGAKAQAAVAKEAGNIEYAARNLLREIMQRADEEEQRRREEEQRRREAEEKRQQDLFAEKPAEGASQEPAPEGLERRAQLLEVDADDAGLCSGLVEQTAAAGLPIMLEKAREQARQDAARGVRCETAGDLSAAIDLPEAMGAHLPALFDAYEREVAKAAPKKRKKGAAS